MSRTRVGVLGGTFDPIHLGHLALAREVRDAAHLDRVLFVPSGDPWQKQCVVGVSDRVAMVRRAIAGQEGFFISLVDVDREGPTYTIDTLADLATQFPNDDLWFIIGADAARGMHTWHRSDELLRWGNFLVVSRPGESAPQAPEGMRNLELVQIPSVDVSSTICRQAIREGKPLDNFVPPAVGDYINEHGLYKE